MGLAAYSTLDEYLSRAVLRRSGALEGVGSCLAEEVHDGVPAAFSAVHLGECVEGVLSEHLVLEVWEEAVGLEVADGGYWYASYAEGPWEAPAEVDGREDVLAGGVEVPGGPSEPSLGGDVVGLGGVPDVHGAEV